MSKIVRLWLYKKVDVAEHFDLLTKTYSEETQVVRGDFKYYRFDGEKQVYESSRREADDWSHKTGKEVETLMGYPAFMHDMGYRV